MKEAFGRKPGEALTPIAAIRRHCVECMGGHYGDIAKCRRWQCHLHPYRMGRRPDKGELVLEAGNVPDSP